MRAAACYKILGIMFSFYEGRRSYEIARVAIIDLLINFLDLQRARSVASVFLKVTIRQPIGDAHLFNIQQPFSIFNQIGVLDEIDELCRLMDKHKEGDMIISGKLLPLEVFLNGGVLTPYAKHLGIQNHMIAMEDVSAAELTALVLDHVCGYKVRCKCLEPICRILHPCCSDLQIDSASSLCSRYHNTVSFCHCPSVISRNPLDVPLHANFVNDGYVNFFCYPTFLTDDFPTIARRVNAHACNKMSCPHFTFKFNTQCPELFWRHPNVIYDILNYIASFINPLQWWVTKVRTCEDIRFFYFLFGFDSITNNGRVSDFYCI